MLQPTLIAAGTNITGTLKMHNELHHHGTMEGDIISSETVIIEHGAHFRGTICAPTLLVRGTIDGEAHCDLVKIMGGGTLHGIIKSFMLIIEPKGQFEGIRTVCAKAWDENVQTKNSTEFDTENILL
ncbi:MAG: polymer-forming cytoskeletal protein [Sulfurospirillaceae bacterium]|nr:polymer-forming cytoskeletal protein [Sulfurospirillaceae bacterium]